MPNIPVYVSQVQPPRRSSAASAAAAGIGEAQRSAFRSVGETIKSSTEFIDAQQGKQETSRLTKDFAEEFAGLTQDWNETANQADPNNPDLAEQWREKVLDPALEKFGEDAWSTGGTELRQQLQAKMRLHFFEKTTADQASLAGAAVKTNLEQAGNALSQAAYADPSSAQFSIDTLNDTIEAQIASHNVTPAQAAQIRDELGKTLSTTIAKSAVRGLAERNPEAAQAALSSGRFNKYLNGEEAATLNTYAKAQQDAKEADARRAKEDAIRDQARASDARRNEIMSTFANTETGQVRIPKGAISQILADPTMNPADKGALIGIVKSLTEKPEGAAAPKTNPELFTGLFNRIHLPDGDPRKITDENVLNQFVNNGLTYDSYNQLRGEVSGRRTADDRVEGQQKQAFINMVKSSLTATNPLYGIRDPKGEEIYGRWLQQFLSNYDKSIRAGANPDELLKENGPFDLGWKRLKRPPTAMMQDLMQDNPGNKSIDELTADKK